jgi:hypothetical protein
MQPKSFKPTRIAARLSLLTAVFSIACSVAQAAIVFDFTDSNQGWTAAVESGSSSNPFNYSATAGLDNDGAWFTDGVATDSIKTLTSPQMTIVADGSVTVSIVHRYKFDDFNSDGGQLRYRVNHGVWTLVEGGSFTTNPYLGIPIDGLGGEDGWSGQSDNYGTQYITSTATFGNFNANDTLEIQFRAGWDNSANTGAGTPNWEIRSVTVANAVPEPATYAVVSGAALMTFAFWRRGRLAVGAATVPAAGTQAGERL